jgi:hypothetical protein
LAHPGIAGIIVVPADSHNVRAYDEERDSDMRASSLRFPSAHSPSRMLKYTVSRTRPLQVIPCRRIVPSYGQTSKA